MQEQPHSQSGLGISGPGAFGLSGLFGDEDRRNGIARVSKEEAHKLSVHQRNRKRKKKAAEKSKRENRKGKR